MDSNHQYWLNNNTNPFNTSNEPSFINSTDGQQSPQPFDAMEHARLSPSAFDPSIFSPSFILPKFVTGGPNGMLGYDLNIAEPERELTRTEFEDISMSRSPSFSSFYRIPSSPASLLPPPVQSTSTSVPSSTVPTASPIYAPYGSSIVSINPPPPLGNKQALTIHPFTLTSSSSSAIYPPPAPWDPASLNLPIPPPNGTSTNFAGLYSSSGFDLLSVLARVAARPNPILMIGPVDTSASFVVADARKFDLPIVFASEGFTKMTGYKSEDIIGRNCRFLQTPDGDTAKGIPRKFTDDGAAYHMRIHIISGKESQCSLINYKKGGQPFINLCTIIPIAWDSQEVAYFVGLSCDLVAQPAAILDRMKDGSYVVNYSLLANNSASSNLSSNKTVTLSSVSLSAQNIIQQVPSPVSQILPTFPSLGEENLPQVSNIKLEDNNQNDVDHMETNSILAKFELNLNAIEAENETNELLDVLMENGGGSDAFSEIADRNRLFKMVLDNSDDFIHVLSLKGSLLYCSPSTAAVLEYDPSEIVGKTFISIIHPNDVNQLMKDLKDAGTSNAQTVSLLYRVRRKFSGYIWIESIGKIHVEPGKTRKCLVLMGRPREVYKMSWNELRRSGGIGETEFWSKLSYEGMVLACTSSVQDLLGFSMGEMVGTSLYQLVKAEFVDEIRTALVACSNGAAVSVKYKTKTRRGYVDVVTRFYPREVDAMENMFSPPNSNTAPTHFSIIAQTNELSSEERKMVSAFSQQAPAYSNNSSDGASPDSELDDLTFGISKSNSRSSQSISPPILAGGAQLTNFNLPLLSYKSLLHPSLISDNLFDELDSSRCNSWQFELHMLTLSNKGLKDEIEYLKRGQAEFQLRKASLPAAVLPILPVVTPLENRRVSIVAAQVLDDLPSCHECGDSGLPLGRTLCDSCALSASDEGTLSGNGFSPMSVENSASPIDWR